MELRFERPSTSHQYEPVGGDPERASLATCSRWARSSTSSTRIARAPSCSRRAGTRPSAAASDGPPRSKSSLYAMVRVLPEHRRQGAGGRIYEAQCPSMRANRRDSIWGRVREDDTESRGFAPRRGFEEVGRDFRSSRFDQGRSLAGTAAGLEIVCLPTPGPDQAVFEVDTEVAPDSPARGPDHEPMTVRAVERPYLRGPARCLRR